MDAVGAATCPHPYDPLSPQLWDYAATRPGHYMREAGRLAAASGPGNGSAAPDAGQQGRSGDSGGSGTGASAAEPELYLCYALEGGLFNQYYTHVSALATAIAIGAKGMVRRQPDRPIALLRESCISPAALCSLTVCGWWRMPPPMAAA